MKRGEVWLTALDPTVGREIRKTRPCLVVSPDELNASLPIVTVAPLTGGSHPAPFRVAIAFADKNGLILTEQLRSVDCRRLIKRMGTVDPRILDETLATLRELFAE